MKKKFLCMLLALTMLLSLVACGGKDNTPAEPDPPQDTTDAPSEDDTTPPEDAAFAGYTYDDETVYMNALGDYYDALNKAKESTDDVDKMYAELALAEAKFLEAGVLLPLRGDGGSYGITRMAPYTIPTTMWGSDADRFETAVVTTELIKVEDREHLISKWGELKGTGEYEAYAKQYLTDQGYTLKDNYIWNGYGSDPETWDCLAWWGNTVSEPICLTVDSLIKYDMENVLQPALAESWEVSEDGLTWTFHLRDAVWTDSQGREVAKVQADDWVAAMQHLFDYYGISAAEVFAPLIVGAKDYCDGTDTDFSKVGVEAVDEKTLAYHLTRPMPTFLSLFSYCGMGAPMCRSYYESQGGTFGPDHDNGTYGTGPDTILYCGPYLITSWVALNSFTFEANDLYWNRDNMNITKVTWPYNDGTDPLKAYNDTMAGTLDGCGLGTSALKKCREDGNFEPYARTSSLNGTTRIGWTNLNRQKYCLYNDETAGISPQTHESVDAIDRLNGVVTSDILDDAARTHAAMNNQNFRLALHFAFDRTGYLAQRVGDELKTVALRNSYVPGNFVSLEKDVTVDINGTATSFPAGTYYGEILQAQIDADGYPIKAWDPEAESGLGSSDGYDGWYNVDNAREYMAKAVEELAAQGIEISKDNPIQIDYYYGEYAEVFVNEAQAYKQSIEASLEDLVVVNTLALADQAKLNSTNYGITSGDQNCVDVALGTAWTADYADPASFLDTVLPYGDGAMCKNLGVW